MNNVFDPVRVRQGFLPGTLMGDWLKKHLEDIQNPNLNLVTQVPYLASRVIFSWLVGLHKEMAPVLNYVAERLGKDGSEESVWVNERSRFIETICLSRWMRDAVDLPLIWEKAAQCNIHSAGKELWGASNKTDRLDFCLAYCVQAGNYELGIEEFEKYHGNKAISLKKPLKPRHLGYAYCLHHVRQHYDEAELFQAGRNMLQYYLEGEWLYAGKGGPSKTTVATMWLKIIYWHRDPTLTRLQTLLKAYENMPNVPVPDFVDLNAR